VVVLRQASHTSVVESLKKRLKAAEKEVKAAKADADRKVRPGPDYQPSCIRLCLCS
jgi:hypothetical protein